MIAGLFLGLAAMGSACRSERSVKSMESWTIRWAATVPAVAARVVDKLM